MSPTSWTSCHIQVRHIVHVTTCHLKIEYRIKESECTFDACKRTFDRTWWIGGIKYVYCVNCQTHSDLLCTGMTNGHRGQITLNSAAKNIRCHVRSISNEPLYSLHAQYTTVWTKSYERRGQALRLRELKWWNQRKHAYCRVKMIGTNIPHS